MASFVDLIQRWQRTVARLAPATVPQTVAAQGEALIARWSEPHRRYHDLAHLIDVLDGVDTLAGHARHAEVVRAAAWFHDAVYAGRPGQDERDSALLAVSVLRGLGAPDPIVDDVARLVLLTIGHRPADGDTDGEVLCDADLAVLASGPDRYRRYADAVRAEYAHVPDEAFRTGRAAVLRGLLEPRWLYRTPTARERWETAARANVAAELRLLQPPST